MKTENNKQCEISVGEDSFFHVYYQTLASVYNLRYTDDLQLLIKMAELADPGTGRVLLPSPVRQELCESLKIHTTNLSKSIKRLREKGLIDGQRGDFTVNPAIFWQGDASMRRQMLSEDGLSITIKFKM